MQLGPTIRIPESRTMASNSASSFAPSSPVSEKPGGDDDDPPDAGVGALAGDVDDELLPDDDVGQIDVVRHLCDRWVSPHRADHLGLRVHRVERAVETAVQDVAE